MLVSGKEAWNCSSSHLASAVCFSPICFSSLSSVMDSKLVPSLSLLTNETIWKEFGFPAISMRYLDVLPVGHPFQVIVIFASISLPDQPRQNKPH